MRDKVADIANLLRIQAAGFEGLVFVLGPLIDGWRASFWKFAMFWSLGVLINSYIFALNDLVDLPHDRTNPARLRSPLVTGRVSPRTALVLSIGLPLTATMVIIADGWPAAAALPFVFMLTLGAMVNLYQKVTRHPLLMDSLFAVTMAAPLPICARAVLPRVTSLTWSTTIALFALALLLNSVAGNLKDLEPDRQTGFRTVAIELGASIGPDGTLHAGARYRRYCWCLYAATMTILALSIIGALRNRPDWEIWLTTSAGLLACGFGIRDMHELLSGARRPARHGREVYFAAGFAILLVVAAVRSEPLAFLAALGLLVIWTSGSALYWRWYWVSSLRSRAGLA